MVNSSPTVEYFGEELAHAREAAGMTQEQLAQTMNYSKSQIAMVETGRRIPKRDFTVRVDNALKTDGRFDRMRRKLLSTEIYREGFRQWSEHEREATSLWTYEAMLVPGLLQTEEYARALLGHDEEKVAARLARQEMLTRDTPPPPALVTLLHEHVLRHPVGDPRVMQEQLSYLAEVARQYVIQIVPVAAQTQRQLDGPFVIGTIDGAELVYVDTPARGFVLDSAEIVSRMRRQWDLIRSEALPTGRSIELIQEVARQWT